MTTRKLLLHFPANASNTPVVYRLVKDYNLMINIFRAAVTHEEEGYLVIDVAGEQADIENGIKYVESLNVIVREKSRGLNWDADNCTSCGNCVPRCPTHALHIPDRSTMKVEFDSSECIECLNCIKNCIYGACTSLF